MGTHRSNPADRRPRPNTHSGKLSTERVRVRTPSKPSSDLVQSVTQAVVQSAQRSPQTTLVRSIGSSSRSSKHQRWGWFWAIVLVLSAGGGVAGLAWVSVQLIVNPQSLSWVNRLVPGWAQQQTDQDIAQSLDAIRSDLQRKGLIAGDIFTLGKSLSFLDGRTPTTDILLPVLQTQFNCQTDCTRFVELRVYQTASEPRENSQENEYYLVNQLAITGIEESFAIAPLVEATSKNQGSSRILPLTSLERYDSTQSPQGVWLKLHGKQIRGNETIVYGQILYYHLKHHHLSSKLEWTSPSGEEPVWKQVTGGRSPELVVNQTIGLEPQFQIYQVQPQNFVQSPVALVPISLSTPVSENPQYQNALLLARNRLWSTSLEWLQGLKKRSPAMWSSATQAQLDLIRWHSQATQTQAEGSWASPSQQILANLVDGRWERATTVFVSSVEASQETISLLKSDIGRIENRVRTALRFNLTKREIKAWGALLLAVQKDQATAIAWLRAQPKTSTADIAYIQGLLQRLDPNFQDTAMARGDRTSRVIGQVQTISQVIPTEWQQPTASPPLQPNNQQTWYRITVTAFHDGKRWQFAESGFTLAKTLSGDALWTLLGLDTDAIVQLLAWDENGNQQTLWASVKGIRVQNSQIQLLATGDALPTSTKMPEFRPLVLTEAALQWLTPDSTTLSDWAMQHPSWKEKALPTLIRELKRNYQLPIQTNESWELIEQWGMGRWIGQTTYLTNPNQPDLILTLSPESLTDLAQTVRAPNPTAIASKPRTLIFSATGKLLYSELSSDADFAYLAIANLADNQPTLIVSTSNGYRLLRWSASRQQFE